MQPHCQQLMPIVALRTTSPREKHTVLKSLERAIESRLRLQSLVKQTGISLAREGRWHPRELVGKVPDGDSHAVLRLETGRRGGRVVSGLLREQLGARGQFHSDVELREGYLHPEGDEGAHVGDLCFRVGCLANFKVALEADSIDTDICGLEIGDDSMVVAVSVGKKYVQCG